MYSNYSFQFLEISSVFLSYHNGNTNISIARVGGGLPTIIKILRLIEQLLRHWNIYIFSFLNLSTSLCFFKNFKSFLEITK